MTIERILGPALVFILVATVSAAKITGGSSRSLQVTSPDGIDRRSPRSRPRQRRRVRRHRQGQADPMNRTTRHE